MPPENSVRLKRLRWLTAALLLLAAARGILFLSEQPLLALANNYDQVRYTACVNLYPYRPGVDPIAGNYQAPLEWYSFTHVPGTVCYWTSELIFLGATALIYHGEEILTGQPLHSVRWIGALRLASWLLAATLFTRTFWRQGREHDALGHAAAVAIVLMDPVDTLYLNTFYAEGSALFYLYLSIGLILLQIRSGTRRAGVALFLVALLLGSVKIQYAALPLLLAALVATIGLLKRQAWASTALPLAAAGVLVGLLQIVNSGRDNSLMHGMQLVNRTDLVLSALLPSSDDALRTSQHLGLPAECAVHSGKSLYQLNVGPDEACPGVGAISPTRALSLLFSEPSTIARMLANAPIYLLPWVPDYVGVIAGHSLARLPREQISWNHVLRRPPIVYLLLLLPLLATLAGILHARDPRSAESLLFAALCTLIAWASVTVAVFGDGIVELAKHAHFALNAALVFAISAPLSWLAGRIRR
jgi:hypothetical protein